jgi:Domain of Unknown Function with PDB structure (DUF3858)/Domain of Unknown Function with PDB structure (DUF3857)
LKIVHLYFSIEKEQNGTPGYKTDFMRSKSLYFAFAFLCISTFGSAQDQLNIKFGKISAADFDLSNNNIIDSNTNAVIIADIGSTNFIGNKKGSFTLVFKRHTRIKILNDRAFDLATVKIPLYVDGDDLEKVVDLKAFTYNLENGKVLETKLEKTDLFEEKIDKNHVEKKFSMPAIKAGSIIEYTYTTNSDFSFNLRPWAFQQINYPCLWSEYGVTIPNLLIYVSAHQGVHSFYIEKSDQGQQHYSITNKAGTYYGQQDQDLNIMATTNIRRWVMKDIPGFQIESYLTSPRNYLDKIEFQLSQVSGDGETYTEVMSDWKRTSENLLQRDDFGGSLHEDNFFAEKELNNITNNISDKLQIANRIYNFMRDNFTCTGHGILMTTSLNNVFKNRRGNVADINLLLISLLNKKGIYCDPVLVSTRDHGLNYFKYPILPKYDYVICKVDIANKTYYLDATHPRLGLGKLDLECFNGKARVIDGLATEIAFSPDSIKENRLTSVYIRNDEKGGFSGSVQQTPGYYESYHLREKIKEKGKDEFIKDLKKPFGTETEIFNAQIDSLDKLEEPLSLKYEFNWKPEKEDIIYLDPMAGEGYKENPFKSQQRSYPVEMPYTIDETYILTFEVPEGYSVEELPKQLAVKLNEQGDGRFEYRITQSGNVISLRSQIKLNRTYFKPEEYNQLREFFNLVVKKHNEQIVFKKKK